MKNRSILKIALILMITLLVSGCSKGSYISKMSTQNDGKDYMEMSYGSFKGYKYKEVELKKGDKLNISIDIKTDSGKLEAKVLDEEDSEIYSVENPGEVINKSFDINKDGKYKIKVEGEHSGSFNLKWNIQ